MTGRLQELRDIVLIEKNNGDILYTIGSFKKDHLYISKQYKDNLESEIIGFGWKDAKYRNDNNDIDLKEMYLSYLEYHYLLSSNENRCNTEDYHKLSRLLKELFT